MPCRYFVQIWGFQDRQRARLALDREAQVVGALSNESYRGKV